MCGLSCCVDMPYGRCVNVRVPVDVNDAHAMGSVVVAVKTAHLHKHHVRSSCNKSHALA